MIDPNHPRAASLKIRDQLVWGVENGLTSLQGLTAQGRGEAFDYLLGEQTHKFAMDAIKAAAAYLLLAKNPVLSTNGNSSALSANEFIKLSQLLNCPIEINLFHRTYKREKAISKYFQKLGYKNILGVGKNASAQIDGIASPRKNVSPQGIKKSDVVFVPLEDGDRTEFLIKEGKKVITIDLNPLSRTAQKATITIVDNLVRAIPLLIETVTKLKKIKKIELNKIIKNYDNKLILKKAIKEIRQI